MNQTLKSSSSPIRVGILAFITGVVIGLVVLGWWLWPVNWTGGDIEHLNSAARLDYLRAAIDSYAVNQDATIATNRYNKLGVYNQTALYEIYSTATSENRQLIENFAAAVMASNALSGQFDVASPEQQNNPVLGLVKDWPMWIYAAAIGLLALLILIIIFGLKSRQRSATAQPAISPVKTFDTPLSENTQTETGLSFEPAEVSPDQERVSSAPQEQGAIEIPDWMQETPFDEVKAEVSTGLEIESSRKTDLDVEEIASIAAEADALIEMEPIPEEAVSEMEEIETPDIELTDVEDEIQHVDAIGPAQGQDEQDAELLAETEISPDMRIGEEKPEQTYAKFSLDLQSLPGIEENTAQKLKAVGISAPLLLLKQGATMQGRKAIQEKTGLEETEILKWVNFADLLRIKGLAPENVSELKQVGVGSLVELAEIDPLDLYEWVRAQAITSGGIYSTPVFEQVENWVSQARKLPKIVT